MRNFVRLFLVLVTLSFTFGCSSWVFRIDIPQGNFVDKEDVEKLRVGMTKEQVLFVMGKPIMRDTFDKDVFYYMYRVKSGRSASNDVRTELYLYFEDEKLVKVEGDYETSEDFNIPLDQ